jgi:hypothetical protein
MDPAIYRKKEHFSPPIKTSLFSRRIGFVLTLTHMTQRALGGVPTGFFYWGTLCSTNTDRPDPFFEVGHPFNYLWPT